MNMIHRHQVDRWPWWVFTGFTVTIYTSNLHMNCILHISISSFRFTAYDNILRPPTATGYHPNDDDRGQRRPQADGMTISRTDGTVWRQRSHGGQIAIMQSGPKWDQPSTRRLGHKIKVFVHLTTLTFLWLLIPPLKRKFLPCQGQ